MICSQGRLYLLWLNTQRSHRERHTRLHRCTCTHTHTNAHTLVKTHVHRADSKNQNGGLESEMPCGHVERAAYTVGFNEALL